MLNDEPEATTRKDQDALEPAAGLTWTPSPHIFVRSNGPLKMTRTIATTELKAKLSEILSDVERGESIGITRHGKMIARIAPEGTVSREEVRRSVDQLRRLRASLPKTGLTLEEILQWRHEGHRY